MPQQSPQSLAFARYVASLEHRDPFNELGTVAVLIDASLPDLYKHSELLAIRRTGDNQQTEYMIAGVEGDGAVAEEVTARYFTLEAQLESLHLSSVLITPDNYTFRYRGEVKVGKGSAYVYEITPRKRRSALFTGQIWIASTGAELLVSGRLPDVPSIATGITFVREMNLDALGFERVTHLSFAIPLLGRSEVVVRERPVRSEGDPEPPSSSPERESSTLIQP